MAKMISENPKISLQDIKQSEQEYDVTLPKQYVDFLLEYNGGYPQKSSFKISDDEGESLVNKFYPIDIQAVGKVPQPFLCLLKIYISFYQL